MEETNTPKFLTEFSNYLIAIKNFSGIYVKNMIITIQQFLDFINERDKQLWKRYLIKYSQLNNDIEL